MHKILKIVIICVIMYITQPCFASFCTYIFFRKHGCVIEGFAKLFLETSIFTCGIIFSVRSLGALYGKQNKGF